MLVGVCGSLGKIETVFFCVQKNLCASSFSLGEMLASVRRSRGEMPGSTVSVNNGETPIFVGLCVKCLH